MSVHSVITPKVKSKGSLLFVFLALVFKHASGLDTEAFIHKDN